MMKMIIVNNLVTVVDQCGKVKESVVKTFNIRFNDL
jgi:hypothetical protein